MLAFVTFNFVLRLIRAGVVRVAFVLKIFCVNFNNGAADVACFGVPCYVVSFFKFGAHAGLNAIMMQKRNVEELRSFANLKAHSPTGKSTNILHRANRTLHLETCISHFTIISFSTAIYIHGLYPPPADINPCYRISSPKAAFPFPADIRVQSVCRAL